MPEPHGKARGVSSETRGRSAWHARSAAALLVLGVVLCVGAYVAAVRARGASFSWRRAMISDLGRSICRDWHGYWVCSPRAGLFNVAVGVAGACILTAGVLTRHRLGRLLTAALVCLGTGLVWVAVFPADGAIGVHMVGGVLALPAPSVLLLAHGLVGARLANTRPADHRAECARSVGRQLSDARRAATGWPATQPYPRAGFERERETGSAMTHVLGALGGVSSLMSLDHVMPAPAPIPRGVAEGVSLLALAVALAVVAWDLARCPRGDTGP